MSDVIIMKETPAIKYRVANYISTVTDARAYLSAVLKEYKEDMPRGRKRDCRWMGRHSITVYAGGDLVTYSIYKN